MNFDEYVLNSDQGVGYDGYSVIDGGSVMTGSSGLYGWNGRKPYHLLISSLCMMDLQCMICFPTMKSKMIVGYSILFVVKPTICLV